MQTFSKLLKTIRREAKLSQPELAKMLGVSPMLISMVETSVKEPSKKFVFKLSVLLNVHPMAIMPFLAVEESEDMHGRTAIEKKLIKFGDELQEKLIIKKAQWLSRKKN